MGFTSFLKSPKKEQHEVPDNTILSSTKFADNTKVNGNYADDDHDHDDHAVDIMDDLERILGIGEDDDQKLSKGMRTNACQLNWDLMDWEETFRDREDQDEEEEDEEEAEAEELFGKDDATSKCFFEEEGYGLFYDNNGFDDRAGNGGVVVKREHVGFWDDDYSRVSLNLNLNYQEVLDAWSDRGSLWAEDGSLSMPPNGSCYVSIVWFFGYFFHFLPSEL